MTVARSTSREGRRCGEQYQQDGSFPAPSTLLEVPPEEVVIVHEVADFQRERSAWRLYLLSRVMTGLYEAVDFQNTLQVRDAYEAFCRGTAWGALYFAVTHPGPASAERTALRLQALLRFWEPLQSVRYRFTAPDAALTLEDLIRVACPWVLEAWAPHEDALVHARLGLAVERLARATHDDSIDAVLRQLPRALAAASGLKHRELLSEPEFQRRHLAMLSAEAFARISGACTGQMIELLYDWDHQGSAQ